MNAFRLFYNQTFNKCLRDFVTTKHPHLLKETPHWPTICSTYGHSKRFNFCRKNCRDKCFERPEKKIEKYKEKTN